jgi:hypothetical protein
MAPARPPASITDLERSPGMVGSCGQPGGTPSDPAPSNTAKKWLPEESGQGTSTPASPSASAVPTRVALLHQAVMRATHVGCGG